MRGKRSSASRRALQARARPRRSADDLLKEFRPKWEKEAAQQQLTGEALAAFRQQILDSDIPQVYCDTDGLFNLRYHIHLNTAAVEAISWNTDVVLEALEWAAVGVLMTDELLSPLEAFIRAEVSVIQATGRANSNGQARLVGVFPIPIPIVESDDDWDTAGKIGDIIHHMGG
ncbi:hypothetical protein ACFZBM_36450 [Streptomyces lavendulae]|uniref:hypothetical protein n=2 Tax=Streptomyces lavendulae TaxID=1914 RepID=UPI0036EE8F06